jgi:hypothetical protein
MAVIIPGPSKDGLRALMKPGNVMCPYLSFDWRMQASCAIHDLPFFEGSPCWTYGNPDVDPDFIAKRGRPCPVGKLLRERGDNHTEGIHTSTLGELEDLGPWPENP